MKMKKTIAIIIATATVLTLTAACSKKNDPVVYVTDANGEIVTNSKGEKQTLKLEDYSIEEVTDENGKVVLDENKEKVTILHYYVAQTDKNGEVVTNDKKEPVTEKHTISNESTTAGKIEALPEGTTIATEKRLFDKKFKDVIASGKCYMEMQVNLADIMGEDAAAMGFSGSVPMIYAANGDKTYIKTSMTMDLGNMSGYGINIGKFDITMEYVIKGDKVYMINSDKKIYSETASTSGSIIDPDGLQGALGSGSSGEYQKTTVVKDGGKEYICEEYIIDGVTYKYYFDKKTEDIKRVQFEVDGETMIYEINKLNNKPADSLFTIPSNFKKVSEEELTKAMLGPLGSLIPSDLL